MRADQRFFFDALSARRVHNGENTMASFNGSIDFGFSYESPFLESS